LDWGSNSCGTAITVANYGRTFVVQSSSANSTNPGQNHILEFQAAFFRFAEATQVMTSAAANSFSIMSTAITAAAQAMGALNMRMYGSPGSRGHAIWGHAGQEPKRDALVRKRERARRSAAEVKAEELLRSCLSREQDEELSRSGWFYVPVEDRVYRIERGHAGNVVLLDGGGKAVERFCIHPSGVPAADAMLAQKLLLESDERKFRSIANITSLR
jgi:hypothetical protein